MKIAFTYDVRGGREKPGKGFIWLLADVNTAPLDWSQNIMRAGCGEVKSKKLVAQELINQMRGCEMRTFFFPYVRGTRLGPGLPLRTSKTLNDDFSPVLNKYSLKFS